MPEWGAAAEEEVEEEMGWVDEVEWERWCLVFIC